MVKVNRKRFFITVFILTFAMMMYLGASVLAQSNKTTHSHSEHLGYKLYKGHLHTHTSLSDGVLLPDDAYRHVKEHTDFDFYAVTEHDVTYDISTGSDFITDYRESYSEEYKILHEQSNAHHVEHEFVTLPGTEVTWYDGAGHINLFDAAWFPRTYGGGADGTWGWGDLKYDLPTFYARLAQDPQAIGQFNHPRLTGDWSFFDFKHYNVDVDQNMNLIEYKSSSGFDIYVKALDRGWHIAPTFGGDEHNNQWGTVQPHVTGIWAEALTREDIYEALRNRQTYVSFDRNFEMVFSANGQMMGSILPADTEEITIQIVLNDPDLEDTIDRVVLYKNGGEIVQEYTNINSNQFSIEETFASEDGDYFFVRAFQKDDDEAISAPIWIGEETRGTEHAPDLTIKNSLPKQVQLGDLVDLPEAMAVDANGQEVSVDVTVIDAKGFVDVNKGQIKIEEYGDYFIKYTAQDARGNIRVELLRLKVDDAIDQLDAEKLLHEFQPVLNVGVHDQTNGNRSKNHETVAINFVTDKVVKEVYVQYRKRSHGSSKHWNNATQLKADTSYFQVAYGENMADSHYRVLASHEVTLNDLLKGKEYEYRFGITSKGPWSEPYTFNTSPASKETIMYVMGDLEVPEGSPDDFELFNNMLDVLRKEHPNGNLMIQVGDLVENGGHIDAWNDVFEYIYKDLNLISAPIVGDRERVTDRKLGGFTGFFNVPKNGGGTLKETNYSFDYGDVHVAVMNSILDFDAQLDWLEEDMRGTNKKWKIVMGHYPYYGGHHSDETGMDIRRIKLSRKLEQLGVSLYIGGHDHVYKRTTIRDGEKDTSVEAMNLGPTFVTVGSSGPIFYEDQSFEWDHIVYDDNKQTGVVLVADDSSLTLKAYNNDGEEIDAFTIEQPKNHIDLTSALIEDSALQGVGVLNYPDSLKRITVIGEKYDVTGEHLLETQIKTAKLEHLGREQVILFDQPLAFEDEHMVQVTIVDNEKDRKPIVPTLIVKEGMIGDGSEDNPFRIRSVDGLNKMHEFPDRHFVLDEDIDGNGAFIDAIGANGIPFTGTFDGNGHTITGVVVTSGGAGIFAVNAGVIKNVGIINTDIDVRKSNVGMLVDQNDGIIENAYSTGSIRGNSTVGGLVGYSNGTVKNSYSTARVNARGRQAGGVVGITNRGSLTENIYAIGPVSADDANAGGLSGYGYNHTVIQNSIALNPSVVTGTAANRIVGRVLAGESATLLNNYADENMFVSSERQTIDDPNNEKGRGVDLETITDPSFFMETLGWDFDEIWMWHEEAQRPLLRYNVEDVANEEIKLPDLDQNDDGYYIIRSVEDLKSIKDFPNENFILANDIDFSDETFDPLFTEIPFFGVFDGNSKTFINFRSERGGLFHLNGGTIKNVALIDAQVSGGTNIGMLVNVSSGTVENSYSTGTISGTSTIGGLVGYSNGIVKNSYSTADVTASGSQAGGLIGITNSGSLTENVYASGTVQALTSNAGGVTGYGYNETVVRNVIALNPSVIAPTMANRVMGRVLAGHTATLENNYAYEDMVVEREGVSEDSPTSIRGLSLSESEIEDPLSYINRLGWDFNDIWLWDETTKRPVLQSFVE